MRHRQAHSQRIRLAFLAGLLWAGAGLTEAAHEMTELPLSPLPLGLNSLMPVPPENPISKNKIDLGRMLFFDKNLSRDRSISCADCHLPQKAFTDGRSVSIGVGGAVGRRNAPTLLNCAYGKTLFWDGRTASLEEQALLPLTSPAEMDNTLDAVIQYLKANEAYRRLFQRSFGTTNVLPANLARALASYQRSLVAANAPFDRYRLLDDASALSPAAQRGLLLFRGKARCAQCHEGSLFSDQKFHNTGVNWGKPPLDLGRFEQTGRDEDRGAFKTPTLRNLSFTAPYMHDGSLRTLEEVVDFYDRGGQPNPHLDPALRPLSLASDEKSALIEFLRSLDSIDPGATSAAQDFN